MLNTSIVLAAVHGLSGLFRAVSAVKPSLFRPLPLLSPSLISNLASVDVKQHGPFPPRKDVVTSAWRLTLALSYRLFDGSDVSRALFVPLINTTGRYDGIRSQLSHHPCSTPPRPRTCSYRLERQRTFRTMFVQTRKATNVQDNVRTD